MLILLLFFTLIRHLQAAPLGEDQVLNLEPGDALLPRSQIAFGTRTPRDIVLTCLATIFACTWTAIHPNIPAPNDSGWDMFKRRVITMIYALIAPEAITAWALRQRLAATRIAKAYNQQIEPNLSSKINIRTTLEEMVQHIEFVPDDYLPRIRRVEKGWSQQCCEGVKSCLLWIPQKVHQWFQRPPVPPALHPGQGREWTTAHGFFLQMGGFMLSRNQKPLRTLFFFGDRIIPHDSLPPPSTDDNIFYLVNQQRINAPTITEADIQDKSKGDVISKTVVILQTTWFFAQCVARWASGLPVTELEVVTLGFVALNGLTYAFWWDKPQNVGVPVYLEWTSNHKPPNEATLLTKTHFRVQQLGNGQHGPSNGKIFNFVFGSPFRPLLQLLVGQTTDHEDMDLRVPRFHSNRLERDTCTILTMTIVSVGFGAVHLAPAWFLIFPSHTDTWLWRISAVVITVAPVLMPMTDLLLQSESESNPLYVQRSIQILFGSATILYIIARIILLTLAFISLRHLPPEAFITIQWLSIFPHL